MHILILEEHNNCFMHVVASKHLSGTLWAPAFNASWVTGLGTVEKSIFTSSMRLNPYDQGEGTWRMILFGLFVALWVFFIADEVIPSPAAHAILTVLKAGETVYDCILLRISGV